MNRAVVKTKSILIGKIALAIGLVAWLVLSDRLQLSRLATVRLGWPLVALFALVAGSMILPAIRWWWLLRIQGLNEPLGKIFRLTWSGYLAALILPGAASGDLAKGYLILRNNSQARARAFSTVLADRFLGLYSLLLLGAVSSVLMTLSGTSGTAVRSMMMLTLTLVIALAVGLAALLVPAPRRFLFRILPSNWRVSWNESCGLYLGRVAELGGCLALSIAGALMTTTAFVFTGKLLSTSVSFSSAMLVGPLVVIANCLPISPGGLGVAESVSSELFGAVGISQGAEFMVLTRICTSAFSLLGTFQIAMVSHDRSLPQTERIGGVKREPGV